MTVLTCPSPTPRSAPAVTWRRWRARSRSSCGPGTQPGDVVVLRGKGVPALNGRGRGDHRVQVNVMLPQRLTDDQRRLLNEFEAAVAEDT